MDRPQAAGIHRDIGLDQHAEDIEHGRARDRRGRVEVVGALREVPVKSTVASRLSRSTVILTLMLQP